MRTVTFAFDCQLNDQEDFIREGTVVEVSVNEFHFNRHEGYIPVVIKEALDYDGNGINFQNPYVEWFSKRSFVEYR